MRFELRLPFCVKDVALYEVFRSAGLLSALNQHPQTVELSFQLVNSLGLRIQETPHARQRGFTGLRGPCG